MKNKNFDKLINDISKCIGSAVLIGDPFEVEKRNAYCISIEKYHELFDLVKELKLQRFFSFLKIFEEKLASLNIVEDSEITKFLLSMTNAVHRVKIGNRVPMKKSVSNGHGKSLK